jgi:hypothetical protein
MMPANGLLMLGVNDDYYQDNTGNNTGNYTVTVRRVG